MPTRVWKLTRWLALASVAACADAVAPPAAPDDQTALAPPAPLLEEAPTEETDGWMAGLVSVHTQAYAWFGTAGTAYGAAHTDFWGNSAAQRLSLVVLQGANQVASAPQQTKEFSQLWPVKGWVKDTISIATVALCGLSATAYADANAAFRVLGQNLSTWVGLGTKTDNSSASAWQHDCPPVQGGGYEDECEFCQQWFYYEDGDLVDEWWDCTPISNSICTERMS